MSGLTTGGTDLEERRLVVAAKAGDRQAYARLLERHQGIAFRAAYVATGSAAEAEDATQEACVRAWLALVALLPLAGAAMALPTTRHEILRVLGLRGVTIERVTTSWAAGSHCS
ncbi:MAG TPA: sigma factor [Solirubrobacteraceae bacterium]